MLERIREARKTESGFTLIELLIVIIILGILAAIVVFAVGNTRKDSVTSSCKTDFKSIELSLESINTKAGSYPATGSTNSWDNVVSASSGVSSTNGALLKSWPSSSDYTFAYAKAASGNDYTVTISGANVVGGSMTSTSAKTVLDAACAGK